MLDIKTFQCNILSENCYVVSDDSLEAVIIDCGALYPEERKSIVNYITRSQLHPVRLLCTHGHLDHCFGNTFINGQYGLKPEVSNDDDFLASDLSSQASDFFGIPLEEVKANMKPRVVATSVNNIIEEYFATNNGLDAKVDGRITILE